MVDTLEKKDLCIVHIGMPKTGSSSLQESLFSKIIDANVVYANLKDPNHSSVIFSMFANHPQEHPLHKGFNKSKYEIEEFNHKNRLLLIESFKNYTSKIEIISGEDIFHLEEDELHKMKSFLEEYFHKIIIVGYVRSPKSFMESAFQQLVKYHEIEEFDFDLIYPHYRLKLEKFDKVFGRENVNLWKFEPKEFPNSDITMDFCSRLNIKIESNELIRVNDSISKEAISLLFVNNKYGDVINSQAISTEINAKLVELLSSIGESKFKFSTSLINNILNRYRDDVEWIEGRLEVTLDEKQNEESLVGVKSEEDLLKFAIRVEEELRKLVKEKYAPYSIQVDTPKDIAKIIDLLKQQLLDERGVKSSDLLHKKVSKEYLIIKNAHLDWHDYFKINHIIDDAQDPIEHYLKNWQTGLLVSYVFDTDYYLKRNPDIANVKRNPLVHFIVDGEKEGRVGSAKFLEYQIIKDAHLDWSDYFLINDIKDEGVDPIYHYMLHWADGLVVSNVFDTSYYLHLYADINEAKINPLVHFLQYGKDEGREGVHKR